MIIVDPHADDNIFTPLSFYLSKRRALKKYEYLKDLNNVSYFFTYQTSSFPKVFTDRIPRFVLKILIRFEIFLWSLINGGRLNKKNEIDDSVFLFLYKKDQIVRQLIDMLPTGEKMYAHLSHYHLYDIDDEISQSPNFFFCYDNDISNHEYFKSKFKYYDKEIVIITFYVQNRFYGSLGSQKNGVSVSGTFHSYLKDDVDFGIYSDGYSTLHPVRHAIYHNNLPEITKENVTLKLSKYTPRVHLFDKLVNFKKYRQKKYFNFDMVKFYSNSKYAIVAGEGTGAIAIGSLEAMATGTIPFLTATELRGLDLPERSYVLYDGTYDGLCSKLKLLDFELSKNDYDVARLAAKKFTYEKLLLKAQETFNGAK